MEAVCDDRLLGLIEPSVQSGQLAFANALRRTLRADAPETFRLIELEADDAYLQPTAFAYMAAAEPWPGELPLIYSSAVAPNMRPPALEARSDALGRVFLAGLGYLSGLPASSRVELIRDAQSPVGYSPLNARTQATTLKKWCIGARQPTVLPYPIQALEEVVVRAGGRLSGIEEASQEHCRTLATALRHIRDCWPVLGGAIEGVVRHIVLFDEPGRNSFALRAAHGVAFVNVALGTGELFFVEELAHQGGHVLFTASWEGGKPLLTVPANSPISELADIDDHRTMEVALHGMFTQTLMVGVLDRLLACDALVDRHEAAGRVALALVRLGLDLRVLASLPVYSDAGMELLRELIATYMTAAERHRRLLMAVDLTEQPYNFDYSIYLARNRAMLDAGRA